MIDNLKEKISKAWGGLTPGQIKLLAKILLFIGCGHLWRAIHLSWPSLPLAIAGLVVFAVASIFVLNLLVTAPKLQRLIPWMVIVFVGGSLNFAALIANNGLMPSVCQDIVEGMYCPIDGARLDYLSDWLWSFVSPGDVLMIIGIVGTAIARIQRQPQHKGGIWIKHSDSRISSESVSAKM